MEDDIIWINTDSENNLLTIFYPNDINDDGNWDILDILLTINFIMDQFEPTPEQNFLADMTQDGIIDILDIIMMVNFVLGADSPTNSEFNAADMNDDNTLNVLDVVLLVNLILN